MRPRARDQRSEVRGQMKRKLFTLAAAVSLLLCLATVVLWVRSYREADELVWAKNGRDYHRALSSCGVLFWEHDGPCPYDLGLNWMHRPIWMSYRPISPEV